MKSVSDKAACSLILAECWPLTEEELPGSGLKREPVWSAEGREGPGVKHILMCRDEAGLPQGEHAVERSRRAGGDPLGPLPSSIILGISHRTPPGCRQNSMGQSLSAASVTHALFILGLAV